MARVEPAFDVESAPYILHELSQPLTAVMINAEAALRWLSREPADLVEVREALERLIGNGHRIADAVQNVHSVVQCPPMEARFDLDGTVQTLLSQ